MKKVILSAALIVTGMIGTTSVFAATPQQGQTNSGQYSDDKHKGPDRQQPPAQQLPPRPMQGNDGRNDGRNDWNGMGSHFNRPIKVYYTTKIVKEHRMKFRETYKVSVFRNGRKTTELVSREPIGRPYR